MAERLHILLIEDSPDDGRRIVEELEGGDFTVEYERVCSPEQVSQALEGCPRDIILADYAMPELTAFDALQIVKRHSPDTPFVLVSGAIGEETAAQLIRAGARDCIMKDNLQRLVPVVQRELREARERIERRRLDSALRESQERARKIVDTAASLIVTLDDAFVIADCNERSREFLGYGRDELIGRSVAELIEERSRPEARRAFEGCLKTDGVSVHDCRLVRRDGGVVDVMASCTSLRDQDGKAVAVLCTMNDITMRTLAEKRLRQDEERESLINRLLLISLSEEVLETQLEKALEQVASVDWLRVVRGAVLLRGERPDALELWVTHGAPSDVLRTCDDTNHARCVCYRAAARKRLQRGSRGDDCPGLCGDLESEFAVYAVPILSHDELLGVLTLCAKGVKRYRAREELFLRSVANALAAMVIRWRAATALSISEDRFRSVVEQSAEGIAVTDTDGRLLLWNSALEVISGVSSADALGKRIWDIAGRIYGTGGEVEERWHAMVRAMQGSAKQQGAHIPTEHEIVRPDGSRRLIQHVLFPVRSATGFMAASMVRDITDIREADKREHRHVRELDLLSRTAISFVELPARADIYRYIGEQLWAILGESSVVAVCDFDEEAAAYRQRAVLGLDRKQKWVAGLLGSATSGFIDEMPAHMRIAFTSGRLVTVAGGAWQPQACGESARAFAELRQALGVSDIYFIGFVRHEIIYGGVTAMLRQGAPSPRISLIEAFVRQASVALARSHAERQLRESEERFRQIADNIQEVFWLEDSSSGNVLYVSRVFRDIWGRAESDLYADPQLWFEAMHPEDREYAADRMSAAAHSDVNIEYRIVRPDDTIRWVRMRLFPIHDARGRIYRRAGIAADITDFKQAAEQARLQREQLVQADKMASLGVLVSGVAHEINNPNNLITLNAGLLTRFWECFAPVVQVHADEVDARQLGGLTMQEALGKFQGLIEGIEGGAVRIKRIVGDLRNFARADSGLLNETVSVPSMIDAAVAIVHNLVKNSTDHFSVVHEPNLPAVRGNTQKLEQVLINLITNACHALENKDGAIEVAATYEAEQRHVTVTVSDTGSGIPAALLKKVMDPFYTSKRERGGTGLGLSVSYSIVNEHGGTLTIESEEGTGTTVRIALPALV